MNKLNFRPFPKLETKRLILRKLEKCDKAEIFRLRSNDKVNKFIDRPKQKSINEASVFINKINKGVKNNEWIYWAITLKDHPKLIGTICLWNFSTTKVIAELGYELNPSLQGKGIMNESLLNVIEYGFNSIGLDIIEAYTHKKNNHSTKLLIKNGFEQDIEQRDTENLNNIIFTLVNKHRVIV